MFARLLLTVIRNSVYKCVVHFPNYLLSHHFPLIYREVLLQFSEHVGKRFIIYTWSMIVPYYLTLILVGHSEFSSQAKVTSGRELEYK